MFTMDTIWPEAFKFTSMSNPHIHLLCRTNNTKSKKKFTHHLLAVAAAAYVILFLFGASIHFSFKTFSLSSGTFT